MICQPAVPTEARVYMSEFKFWYKDKHNISHMLLCCFKSSVTCPACLSRSVMYCCDVPPAFTCYHRGTPLLGN